jgi:hypothetical protein
METSPAAAFEAQPEKVNAGFPSGCAQQIRIGPDSHFMPLQPKTIRLKRSS